MYTEEIWAVDHSRIIAFFGRSRMQQRQNPQLPSPAAGLLSLHCSPAAWQEWHFRRPG